MRRALITNDIHGSAARKNRQKLIVIIIIALVPDEKSPNEMRYEYFIVLIFIAQYSKVLSAQTACTIARARQLP